MTETTPLPPPPRSLLRVALGVMFLAHGLS